MRSKVTNQLVDEMEKLYNQGLTTREVARELTCGQATVCRHLINRGYDLKKRGKDQKEFRYIEGEKLFLEGMSAEQVAKTMKLSSARFCKWLKSRGHIITNPAKKYTQNDDFFKVIDTEEKAYWLGFLYADGCILTRCRGDRLKSMHLEISLARIDKSHIEKFKEAIQSTNVVKDRTTKLDDKTHESSRLTINSTKMCRDLIDKGCHPRKSLTLTFPSKEQVPDHLVKHFVRGYVDGDGSIMWNTNKRWGRITILGTQEFLEGMVERMGWSLKKLTGCNSTNDKLRQIEYGGKDESIRMLKNLYSDANVYLDRKYKKYKEIIAVLEGDL